MKPFQYLLGLVLIFSCKSVSIIDAKSIAKMQLKDLDTCVKKALNIIEEKSVYSFDGLKILDRFNGNVRVTPTLKIEHHWNTILKSENAIISNIYEQSKPIRIKNLIKAFIEKNKIDEPLMTPEKVEQFFLSNGYILLMYSNNQSINPNLKCLIQLFIPYK